MNYTVGIYLYLLLVIGFFTIINIIKDDSRYVIPPAPHFLALSMMLFMIGAIAFHPVVIYDDKYNYLNTFNNLAYNDIHNSKDIGWAYYTFLIKALFNSADVYFLTTAVIYVIGYYCFARKYFPKAYVFIFLLVSFTSFGFFAYGANTLRAGFSLSLLLLAITYHEKTIFFILLGLLAILCHKSMTLPLLFFVITKYYNNPNVFIVFWIIGLFLSILNIDSISLFLQSFMGSFDERSTGYFEGDLLYRRGFRIDFIIYSLIPILVGYHYINKLKFNNVLYIRLFNTYLLTNVIWLLVIRMNFTDRIAYLSWFLIPFILLYPLLIQKLNINQKKYLIITLIGVMSFTLVMSLR